MPTPWWPLADLRLSAGDVLLRPVIEGDLRALAAILPADVDFDPSLPRFAVADERQRTALLSQTYWRAMGTWRTDEWTVPFVVTVDGAIVGWQTLEGSDFLVLRTVDSASWLATAARGHGVGKAARRLVLALAFGPLRARAAISSALLHNAASLGVSRALGYEPNGVSLLATRTGEDEPELLCHVRLTADTWEASGQADGVIIEGFDACRPLFGLESKATTAREPSVG